MKSLLVCALLGAPVLLLAQAPAKAPASPATSQAAAKPPAKPAAKPVKSAAKRPAPQLAPSAQKAVEEVTPLEDPDPRILLSEADLEVARKVHVGDIPCELGASVRVTRLRREGFFLVSSRLDRFVMHPVESRTGAVRLEDPKRGAMWLQLGNKSMLMSQKLGRRLADECQSNDQAAVAENLRKNPLPSILDALPTVARPAASTAAPAAVPGALPVTPATAAEAVPPGTPSASTAGVPAAQPAVLPAVLPPTTPASSPWAQPPAPPPAAPAPAISVTPEAQAPAKPGS